jgi:hypothetical protein
MARVVCKWCLEFGVVEDSRDCGVRLLFLNIKLPPHIGYRVKEIWRF